MEMLILMIFNSEGQTISVDDFKILAVIPSSLLDASSEPMKVNFTLLGTLEST